MKLQWIQNRRKNNNSRALILISFGCSFLNNITYHGIFFPSHSSTSTSIFKYWHWNYSWCSWKWSQMCTLHMQDANDHFYYCFCFLYEQVLNWVEWGSDEEIAQLHLIISKITGKKSLMHWSYFFTSMFNPLREWSNRPQREIDRATTKLVI